MEVLLEPATSNIVAGVASLVVVSALAGATAFALGTLGTRVPSFCVGPAIRDLLPFWPLGF